VAEMKLGDVRKFKGKDGKAIAVTFGLWAERKSNTQPIHIHITGSGGNTTVNNDPKSERYHRTLFRNLRRILTKQDRWEYGEEGSETEEK
jgi:hypothetical protein